MQGGCYVKTGVGLPGAKELQKFGEMPGIDPCLVPSAVAGHLDIQLWPPEL